MGTGRREFVEQVEVALEKFWDTEAEALLQQNSPDEYFRRFDEIVGGIALQHFRERSKYTAIDANYEKYRSKREQLLLARRHLRDETGDLFAEGRIAEAEAVV